MRLDKYLTEVGLGSRSTVKKIIKNKKIKVNNQIIVSDNYQIDELNDEVKYNDETLKYQKFHTYMLNKPAGYITSTKDKGKIVTDLIIEATKYKLKPVGRLDKDTEGLLILTNDGQMIHTLTSPKKDIPKTYYVEYLHNLSLKDIESLEHGVILDDGYKTLPSKVAKVDGGIYLTINEGKFHQVKRMMEAVNNKVTYLKRIKVNNLYLDESLKLGEYKELSSEELSKLLKL